MQRAGVQRIVVVSIIGIDRFTGGYSVAKGHEQAMLAGPIPVRILRAAQFHEFVAQLVEWGTQDDVSYVPKMRTQLVAGRGPSPRRSPTSPSRPTPRPRSRRRRSWRSPARVRRASSRRRGCSPPAAATPVRGRGASANPADPDPELYEQGALLPGPHATLAGPTFEEWLAGAEQARRPGRPPPARYGRRRGEIASKEDTMKYLLQIYAGLPAADVADIPAHEREAIVDEYLALGRSARRPRRRAAAAGRHRDDGARAGRRRR